MTIQLAPGYWEAVERGIEIQLRNYVSHPNVRMYETWLFESLSNAIEELAFFLKDDRFIMVASAAVQLVFQRFPAIARGITTVEEFPVTECAKLWTESLRLLFEKWQKQYPKGTL